MSASQAPERIRQLAALIGSRIDQATREIGAVNLNARLLAMNTRVEAARLGAAGSTFQVIGGEMTSLSERTGTVAKALSSEATSLVSELGTISARLATEVRGRRLADLALVNIDLLDRNLYERSCDCRWWATDASFVAALQDPTPERRAVASGRMEVILKAYTVYFDIVLADLDGTVIASGRGGRYRSQGTSHRAAPWFEAGMATRDGDAFGFQSVHASTLAGGERALVYSAKVCEGGRATARPLGVLGIVFRWDALAHTIVESTPVDPADRAATRSLIVDAEGLVLADSGGRALQERFAPAELEALRGKGKGYVELRVGGKPAIAGYAESPGFETYASGWNACVVQALA